MREADSREWHDRREQLLNAFYKSLPEIPALESFLRAACALLPCSHASVLIALPSDGQGRPLGMHDSADHAGVVEALAVPELFDDLPLNRVTCRDSGEGLLAGWRIAILPVADELGRTASLVLWREMEQGAFAPDTLDLLASLAEPLKRGLGIYYRCVDLERQKHMFSTALETSGIAVVLADAEGNVLLTNGVADSLLAQGDGLSLSRGKLRAQTPGETAKLLDRVRANAAEQSARSDWSVFSPLSLAQRETFLPLTVIVRPGPAYYPLKEPLRRTATLIIRDPSRQAILSATTLAQLFGLTPAEALLASELASGASLEEAAASLGVSRNTVRSQLQSVFQKTGTNRQVELVRVLLNSAATAS